MIKGLFSVLVAISMLIGGINTTADQAERLPEMLQHANSLLYKTVKLGTEGHQMRKSWHIFIERK